MVDRERGKESTLGEQPEARRVAPGPGEPSGPTEPGRLTEGSAESSHPSGEGNEEKA